MEVLRKLGGYLGELAVLADMEGGTGWKQSFSELMPDRRVATPSGNEVVVPGYTGEIVFSMSDGHETDVARRMKLNIDVRTQLEVAISKIRLAAQGAEPTGPTTETMDVRQSEIKLESFQGTDKSYGIPTVDTGFTSTRLHGSHGGFLTNSIDSPMLSEDDILDLVAQIVEKKKSE